MTDRRRLPFDVCRCHDDDCPDAARCARWLDRNHLNPRTPSADSLFPFDTLSIVNDACPAFIEVKQ